MKYIKISGSLVVRKDNRLSLHYVPYGEISFNFIPQINIVPELIVNTQTFVIKVNALYDNKRLIDLMR